MQFSEFEDRCFSTARTPPQKHSLLYLSNAIAGEAGEFANKVKKLERDLGGEAGLTDEIRHEMALELFDTWWYITVTAKKLGFDLQEIAERGLAKLLDRKRRDAIQGSGDAR